MVGAWQSSLLIGQLSRRGQRAPALTTSSQRHCRRSLGPVDSSIGNPCSGPAELVRGIVFCVSLNRRNRLKGGENWPKRSLEQDLGQHLVEKQVISKICGRPSASPSGPWPQSASRSKWRLYLNRGCKTARRGDSRESYWVLAAQRLRCVGSALACPDWPPSRRGQPFYGES